MFLRGAKRWSSFYFERDVWGMDKKPLRGLDYEILDYVFDMGGGYVLDFSNRTFSEFFIGELGVNIDDSMYFDNGASKAKRLKSFLSKSGKVEVLRVLTSLWEYREVKRKRAGVEEVKPDYISEYWRIIEGLGGKAPKAQEKESGQQGLRMDAQLANDLLCKLMGVSKLDPHSRGYAFEKFLKELFDSCGLSGRSSFRLVGEQIDGSFELNGETYLLEAKWTSQKVDASGLRSFNAKVEDKSSWSRGLFISDSGFTEDGLVAFGAGKSLICMDGLDLSEILISRLSFQEVLSKKVRRAAETGRPFVRVRDLS